MYLSSVDCTSVETGDRCFCPSSLTCRAALVIIRVYFTSACALLNYAWTRPRSDGWHVCETNAKRHPGILFLWFPRQSADLFTHLFVRAIKKRETSLLHLSVGVTEGSAHSLISLLCVCDKKAVVALRNSLLEVQVSLITAGVCVHVFQPWDLKNATITKQTCV